MKTTHRLSGVLTATALLAVSGPAAAQLRIDVEPYAGVYVPLRNVLPTTDVLVAVSGETTVVQTTALANVDHHSSLALGGRATLWLSQMFGAQGTATYAFSDLGSLDAHVWLVSARAVAAVFDQGAISLQLSAGPSLVARGGRAYEGIDGTLDVGGVIGAGAGVDLGSVRLRILAEDYFYSTKLSDPRLSEQDSRLQSDLVLSGALVLAVGR